MEIDAQTVKGGDETILVVEDDDDVRIMISEILDAQGYGVVTARNGREALDILSSGQSDVSLVMTDIVMPLMGGREMCGQIRSKGFDLPIIAMSGFPEKDRGTDWLRDVELFLQKPFGPVEVSQAVRATLDGRRGTTSDDGPSTSQ